MVESALIGEFSEHVAGGEWLRVNEHVAEQIVGRLEELVQKCKENGIGYLTPTDLSFSLNVSLRQVYRWIDAGELSTNKVDGNHKITEGALAEKVGEELAAEVFRRAAESREDE
jgi:hypothetical protein